MKSKNEILTKIRELEADERHKCEPALVQINAPLALMQVEIQSKIDALMWVLNQSKIDVLIWILKETE